MQVNASAARSAVALSKFTPTELHHEATSNPFTKWATLALLRYLKLPTLDAAFIPPRASAAEVKARVMEFAQHLGASRLLLRSDGGREVAAYHRAGDTVAIDEAIADAAALSGEGRAVIAMEPTNRFDNKLVVGMLADRNGDFFFEILGPGYDASDLSRGGVPPQWWIHGETPSWQNFDEVDCAGLEYSHCDVPEEARRRIRLTNVATHMMLRSPRDAHRTPEEAGEWLKKMGYTALWAEEPARPACRTVRQWFDDLFLIANYYARERSWRVISTSACRLENGRFVYWDVVDAARKWQAP